ncbi:MAG: hypothetical protein E6527_01830 [Mixta calida]|nr:hypothetical protein [Mixta calida]
MSFALEGNERIITRNRDDWRGGNIQVVLTRILQIINKKALEGEVNGKQSSCSGGRSENHA